MPALMGASVRLLLKEKTLKVFLFRIVPKIARF